MDRLLLVGDSITKQIAPYFAERYPAVDVRWVGADGIGPLTAQGHIVDLVQEAVASFDPDMVLFEFAGSYTNKRGGEPFRLSDGTEVEDGTELMFEVWSEQSQLLVREARAKGATVLWALAPPVDPDGYFKYLAPNIERFNDIYKSLDGVVARRLVRGVRRPVHARSSRCPAARSWPGPATGCTSRPSATATSWRRPRRRSRRTAVGPTSTSDRRAAPPTELRR